MLSSDMERLALMGIGPGECENQHFGLVMFEILHIQVQMVNK